MVKKTLLTIVLCLTISVVGYSQTVENNPYTQQIASKFGYTNSNELLELIPEKVNASKAIKELNQKYKDELLLMQNDYKKKYTDFITDQGSMAESIKLRRMQELHELEQNINNFMKIAQEDIDSQEEQLIKPLKRKVFDAIQTVSNELDLICVYDLANPSIAFVSNKATDITPLVKKKLGIK